MRHCGPGVSGSLGTGVVARSPGDGYGVIFVFDTHAVNPALIKNLPFDTQRDLAPAASAILTVTLLQEPAGIKLVHAPYRSGGPMTQDALGGHIELIIGSVAVLAYHIESGGLRAVVVTGDRRSHAMPDGPTLAESGFPGFSAAAWWGKVVRDNNIKPEQSESIGAAAPERDRPWRRRSRDNSRDRRAAATHPS